jgi:hypothetical protein
MRSLAPALAIALSLGCGGGAAGSAESGLPENRPEAEEAPAAPPPPEDPVARSDRELVDLGVELLAEIGRVAAAHHGACEPMAAAIGAISHNNAEVWEGLAAIGRDPARRAALEGREDEIGERATAVAEAVGDCAGDPAVREALAAIHRP